MHFNSRYVCWSAYLIKRHPKLASALGNDLEGNGLDYTAKIPLDQKLYFQYFVQDDIEDGTLMDTKVPVKEVINYDRETFEWAFWQFCSNCFLILLQKLHENWKTPWHLLKSLLSLLDFRIQWIFHYEHFLWKVPYDDVMSSTILFFSYA